MELSRRTIQRMIPRESGDTTVINQGSEGGGGGVTLGPLLASLNAVAMPTAEGYLHWNGSAWEFPSIDLSSYATKQWVLQQGYITSSAISDMATKTWVLQQGYITSSAISDMATETWVLQQGYITPSAISDMVTKTWVGQNCLVLTQGKLADNITFSGADDVVNGLVFYYGNTNIGKFGVTKNGNNYYLSWTPNSGTAKKVLFEGDAPSFPFYASTADGTPVNMNNTNGLSMKVRSASSGVYALDYLPMSGGTLTGSIKFNNDYTSVFAEESSGVYSLVAGAINGVQLRHNGSTKLRTSAYGVNVSGGFGVSGSSEFGGQMVVRTYGDAKLVLNDMPYENTEPDGHTYIEFRTTNTSNVTSVIGALGLFGDATLKWMDSSSTLHTIATQDWVNSQGHVASAGALKYSGNTKVEATIVGATVIGDLKASSLTVDAGYSTFVEQSLTLSTSATYNTRFYTGGSVRDNNCTFAFNGTVESSNGFKKTGSSDDNVLLGGGGTKAVSDFVLNNANQIAAKTIAVLNSDDTNGVYIEWDSNGYLNIHGDTNPPMGYVFDAPVTQSSDIRLKNIVSHAVFEVDKLATLPLVCFTWKKDERRRMHFGSIAQEWQKVLPEVVSENGDGMLAMDYGAAAMAAGVTACRKAVELERRIAELEEIINQLKQ